MAPDAETRDLISTGHVAQARTPGAVAVWSGDQPLLVAIPAGDGALTLGRDEVHGITDDRISRRHATVRVTAAGWTITDHDSRNGTFVNAARVTGTTAVAAPRVVRTAYSLYLLVDAVEPLVGATVRTDGDRVLGPAFAAALAATRQVTDRVLISGETGVGKELAARELHAAAGGGPFVAVNCAAIPETVAERLVFGAVKGAFTGATDAEGYIAAADGGTLFLDEIGELAGPVQAKLLRVLETREVVPLGGATGRRVTTRFCFATSRNLRSATASDEFRADLYYRIAEREIRIPPLRERREEIPWIVAHELARADPPRRAHPRLVEACLVRAWPGNVRELRAAVRAAVAGADPGEPVVRPEHLAETAGVAAPAGVAARARPEDLTREQLARAIAEHGGNLAAVARALGLHRSQLYRLLERHDLSR